MTKSEILEQLKGFIGREMLDGQEIGLNGSTRLLEWGIIDSVSLLRLRAFIERHFRVTVPQDKLTPKNLETLDVLSDLVANLQSAGRT